uniref:RIKEN cDNA 4933430I17 gene n=1 Tax=Nannospalax galili TaxID=1026970 RepID=A0A8C6RK77_NANGA
MRSRSSVWAGPVLKGREASDFMNLPNESQWDETTCNSVACQHPQCWAALRRIERGHPRILDPSVKTPQDAEDKLPTLTIVNISDTCLWAKKRVTYPQSSEYTFPKERSLLSKLESRCQGRSRTGLFDKGVINGANRPPKLSVLNLNEVKLPFCEGVGNMVVTWIPGETEKTASSARKKSALSSWHGKKRRKELVEKVKPSSNFPGKQSPGVAVPPRAPVLSSDSIPVWAQVDMLPQDLLKECILAHGGKSMPCPEVKTEVAKMRKNHPLEKDRPDSAISSKMYLTIHRLTLQRPSLRYPEYLRKLHYHLKRDGSAGAGASGLKIPSGQDSDRKQKGKQEEAKMKATTKHVSACQGSEIYETESIYKDITAPEEAMIGILGSRQDSRSHFETLSETDWNPELKLLRILQAEEDEEDHPSGTQSEASLEA